MLEGSLFETSLSKETMQILVRKDGTQKGVLSSLLWDFVTDELLVNLNNASYHIQGYADGKNKYVLTYPINASAFEIKSP